MDNHQPHGYFEPVHREFHSNNPSSCCLEHAAGAQATIGSTEPTLASLDRDIACLNSVIDNLNRIRLDKILLRNQSIPISSLPPEILQEIFIACLDLDDEKQATQHKGVPMPLRLGHVCSLWRMIALKFPTLWATVNCHVSHPRDSSIVAELIFDWISRSQGRPLTIHISFDDERIWATPDAPTDIIDTLVLFSERWKHVSLVLPISWQMSLSSIKGRLNSLETLRLQRPGFLMNDNLLDAFSVAPRLFSLSFEGFYLQSLLFPWTNITKAAIRQPSLDEVFEFISRCPSMTECFIVNPTGNESIFPWPTAAITHGGVKDLTIMLQGDDWGREQAILFSDIAENLITPSLERLTVLLKEHDDPLLDVFLLIERSGCPLGLVEVFGPTIPEEDMIAFIGDTDCVSRITNNPKDVHTLDLIM
ncbi:hypothetical protein D9619_008690 [Psilocybe cf. subviscida]|uniref:F-box domain-containing protein n=1 Tax=Psilocybe cf. subviscida TaxID=2480587 RepID=A0A8H5F0Z6_9AGAR|nr:hypothetical protein D9619_008690 [Psilocybe cf. subviscida]